jgi:transcriptional regulator with XRE-family HTH domain
MQQWSLAERVRYAVELAGGLRPAARASGVSSSALARYMNGENAPRLAALTAIGGAAGVRVEWLMQGAGAPTTAAPAAHRSASGRVSVSASTLVMLVREASADLPPEARDAIRDALKD